MTKDELIFKIQTKQPFEFKFRDKTYNMTYDKNKKGEDIIVFGRLFEGVPYSSFGELINTARLENCFFKDVLPDL